MSRLGAMDKLAEVLAFLDENRRQHDEKRNVERKRKTYPPDDTSMLGEPPWQPDDPRLIAWEEALAAARTEGRREGFNECAKRTLEAIRRERDIPEGHPLLTILVPDDAILDAIAAEAEAKEEKEK